MSDQSTERKTLTATCLASSYEMPKEGGKCIAVTFKFKGEKPEGFTNPSFKALAHTDTWSEEDFKDDETIREITFEVAPPSQGKEANGNTNWLMKWNGKEKAPYKPANGGQGGNRGGGYTKTAEEVHSASICGIIKTAADVASSQCSSIVDYASTFDQIANPAIDKYFAAMDKAKSRAGVKAEAA